MGKVQIGKDVIVFDDKFSQEDFTGRTAEIPDYSIVYGSCFSRERPDSLVFSEKMTGVTFYNCNLDNVFIPDGNTMVECTQNRFQAQSDGQDWLVDEKGDPVQPLNPPSDQDIPIDISGGATPVVVTLNNQVLGQWVWVPESADKIDPVGVIDPVSINPVSIDPVKV